jgi:hypothetical protein
MIEKSNNRLEGGRTQESSSVASESPLVVLRRNINWWFFSILLLAGLTLYGILGVILPVLATGDYAAVGDKNIAKGIYAFFLFCFIVIAMPFCVPVFKQGFYYFYNDRMEVDPFWGRRRIVIPYKQMHVRQCGGIRMTITAQAVPGWAHPLEHYRVLYWNGLSMGIIYESKIAGIQTGMTRMWENPADVPKAIQILQEKAFEFIAN